MSGINRTEAIRLICAEHGGKGFYLDPIPEKKLRNARKSFPIKPDWVVIGLVDDTVFGSAKKALRSPIMAWYGSPTLSGGF